MDDAVEEEKVAADRAFPCEYESPSFIVISNDRDDGGTDPFLTKVAGLGTKIDGERNEGVTKALVVIDATKQ